MNVPISGYWKADHPIQQLILNEVADSVSQLPKTLRWGIDGCGVPTFFVTLTQLALAYSKLSTANCNDYNDKLGIIKKAMMEHPFMVAGSFRADTDLMRIKPVIAKAGAQAVYCIAVPKEKIGISIKIESGCEDASESVAIEMLRKLGILNTQELNELDQYWHRPVYNCTGKIVGSYRTIF